MNLVLIVFAYLCCRSIARVVAPLFLICSTIILTAAQKNYVLDAPLGDRPIAGADVDVMNV